MFKFGSSSFGIENNDNNKDEKIDKVLKELTKMYLEEKASRENLEKIIESNKINEELKNVKEIKDVKEVKEEIKDIKKEIKDINYDIYEMKKERISLKDEINLEFCDKLPKKIELESRLIKLEKIGKKNDVDYLIKFSFIEKHISNNLLFSISDDFINIENVQIYITISRVNDKKHYVTVSIENPIYRLYWKRILVNSGFDVLNIQAISNKDSIYILSGENKVNEINFKQEDFFNNMIYTQIVYE